ncbi:MAG: hypothetical protein FWG71_07705 [Synergistaceae bacterium]|nr:hypothetical protein [Synergistaceae bacterium]
MQINGVNEFFSRIASLNGSAGVRGNSFSPALIPQGKAAHDSLLLSDVGKKLSLDVNKAPLLSGSRVNDPVLIATEKYLSEAETILTRMHELATAAQDGKLTGLDRINMQIEMEELRKELMVVEFDYKAKVDGTISYAELGRMNEKLYKLLFDEKSNPLAWERGDDTTLLGRARDRIMRGEKWDVKEAFVPFGIVDKELVYDKEPTGVFITSSNGISYSETLLKIEGGRWTVIDDESIVNASLIPTVREQLERGNTIILMDAKSAADGVKRLEEDIEAVRKLRDNYTKTVSSYQQSKASGEPIDTRRGIYETAKAVFKRIAFGSNATLLSMTSPSPIEPNLPEFFYFGENDTYGIPDRIVASRNVRKVVSPEDYAKGLGTIMDISAGSLKPVDVNMDINMYSETYKQKPPMEIKLDIVA